MDSQYSTAAIEELMGVVRHIQNKPVRQADLPVFVILHWVLSGIAALAFVVAVSCRIAGYKLGDDLTDEYVFSLITSVLFFTVGTLMIESMRGDVFGGILGRALAGCGLFVMACQGYEFMEQTRACEIQAELLASQKATEVNDDATLVSLHRQVVFDGFKVDWESNESTESTGTRTVSGMCAKVGSSKAGVVGGNRDDRGSDAVRGRAGDTTASGLQF